MSSHFRIEVKTLSRASGQSSAASYSYDINREKKGDLAGVGGVNMPSWAASMPGAFWRAADEYERANASLCRRVIVSFPNELNTADRDVTVREWLKENCPNMPASWCIHDHPNADPRNPHCHILISERVKDGIERPPELFFKRANKAHPALGGCAKADIGSNRKQWLADARESWATTLNKRLPANAQVSHLSLVDQGITDHEPQPKFGQKVLAAERRGIRTGLVSSVIEDARHHCQVRCLSFFDKDGREVTFRAAADHGDRINVIGKPSVTKCREMVKMCKEKGWASVAVDGTAEFQKMMKIELEKAGIKQEEGEKNEQNIGDDSEPNGRGQRASGSADGDGRDAEPAFDRAGHEPDSGPGGGTAGGNGEAGADVERTAATTAAATTQANVGAAYTAAAADHRVADRRGADRRRDIDYLARQDVLPTGEKRGVDMQKDLTYIQVKKQLAAMPDVGVFDIGIRDSRTGRMQNLELTAGQILAEISMLKRENARGSDIYIRPSRANDHGYILLDDVGVGTINQMREGGLEPNLEIETSPMNYQVWLRVSEQVDQLLRKGSERVLQERYKSDIGSCDGAHYGRLVGFTNRKQSRVMDNGQHPFCKLSRAMSTAVMPDDAWNGLKDEATRNVAHELADVDVSAKPLPLVAGAAHRLGGVTDDQMVQKMEKQFAVAKLKWGPDFDLSRADFFISRNCLQDGATQWQVQECLKRASPDIAIRKEGHLENYVSRTVDRAYASVSELVARDRAVAAQKVAELAQSKLAEQVRIQKALVAENAKKPTTSKYQKPTM